VVPPLLWGEGGPCSGSSRSRSISACNTQQPQPAPSSVLTASSARCSGGRTTPASFAASSWARASCQKWRLAIRLSSASPRSGKMRYTCRGSTVLGQYKLGGGSVEWR
jgi:hypothetical protein